jgi:hypothetical protein
MASLANQTISSTYDGLIKTSTDQPVGVSGVQLLEDGVGNSLALSVGRANQGVTVTGTLTATTLTGTIAATSVLADGVTATTQSLGDNSTKVATTAYVDAQVTASDLDFAGDSGTGAVDLDSQSLTIAGTANEIETSASGQTITIGLPNNVNVAGNLTVDTNTLFVDATNNNVGIGVTDPNNYDVSDNPILAVGSTSTAANSSQISILSGSSAIGYLLFGDGQTGNEAYRGQVRYSHTDDSLQLVTAGSERLRIDSSGQVGIGTSSPSTMLNLSANNNLAVPPTNVLRFTDTDTACSNDQAQGAIEFYTNDNTSTGVASAIKGLTGSGGAALGRLVFETAGTEKMRLNSDGWLGIGTSAPSSNVDIVDAGSAILRIQTEGTTDAVGIQFGDADSPNAGRIIYDHSADAMEFRTNSIIQLSINNAGNAFFTKGIFLNGETAADNQLNDYEEGTFEPVIADAQTGGNTSTNATDIGNYTKVGNLVTISVIFGNIDTTGMTGANVMYIRNLPYTPSETSHGSILTDQITFSGNYIVPQVVQGSSFIRLKNMTSGATDSSLTVNSIASGSADMFFTVTYIAS